MIQAAPVPQPFPFLRSALLIITGTCGLLLQGCLVLAPPPVTSGMVDVDLVEAGHGSFQAQGGAGIHSSKPLDRDSGDEDIWPDTFVAGGAIHARLALASDLDLVGDWQGGGGIPNNLSEGESGYGMMGGRVGIRHHLYPGVFTLGGGVSATGWLLPGSSEAQEDDGNMPEWIQADLEVVVGERTPRLWRSLSLRIGPNFSTDPTYQPGVGFLLEGSFGFPLNEEQAVTVSALGGATLQESLEEGQETLHSIYGGGTVGWMGRF